jgi:hypothetical protein
MLDEVLKILEGHVSIDPDAMEQGLGDAEDSFADTREDVGLLEVGEGIVIDHGYGLGELVAEDLADSFVGGFAHLGDRSKHQGVLEIKINPEMLGRVGLPAEILVENPVLAVVREVPILGGEEGGGQQASREEGKKALRRSHGISSLFGNQVAFLESLIAENGAE